jgi:hypothetical protein
MTSQPQALSWSEMPSFSGEVREEAESEVYRKVIHLRVALFEEGDNSGATYFCCLLGFILLKAMIC